MAHFIFIPCNAEEDIMNLLWTALCITDESNDYDVGTVSIQWNFSDPKSKIKV
jgi:hypothetical protein